MPKALTTKQRAALRKGANMMYKAIQSQKKAGTKTKTIKAGGVYQKVTVYKKNLSELLKNQK